MVEANQLLPMVYAEDSNIIIDMMRFYFKEKWLKDIYNNLKDGYSEMSQINLSLAELGLEQDLMDLTLYEARLLGREFL